MTKAALIFVFNHKFEKNVPRLAAYYGSRFETLKYLMPFSSLDNPDVIRIIENGYTFSGHIAQGVASYSVPGVTHYVFLGDDLVLNPRLSEHNLVDELGLKPGVGYTKNLVVMDDIRHHWPWAIGSTSKLADPGFAYDKEIPNAGEAGRKFTEMGFSFRNPWPRTREDYTWMLRTMPHRMRSEWIANLRKMGKPSAYPLLAGYSDFVVVPAESVQKFAHYCGVFAAINLFAEVAVPTALALACAEMKTELALGEHFMDKQIKRRPDSRIRGIELWGDEVQQFGEAKAFDWNSLLHDFPMDVLYYHPVKLSMWK